MNALRIIGKNINQLAKKANEINSIYAEDYENFKKEYEKICLISPKTHTYKTNINHISPCKKIKVLRNSRHTLIEIFSFYKHWHQTIQVLNLQNLYIISLYQA